MDTAPLKSFATWARTALIREVTARIAVVLAPSSSHRVEQSKAVAALEGAITAAGGGDKGRAAVADRVAYTWFNRIIALRFMDANGYTGIGVVSPQAGVEAGQPEILAEAKRANIDAEVVSQGTREIVTALLNGTRRSDDPQGEAYALLLAEYCRHWNRSMPFMFERQGDFTELLIPGNLLVDDSVLNRAVKVLTEDACHEVEVIGWLYQFYISERKDEVFAGFKKNKKAGADEIPAATQLFTPHWIVRYLVENSLGRLWMLNRPTSSLVNQMHYYVAPVDEETNFLKVSSPEELTVMDPACGSGHMLTYAFDLLYLIYEEEGYTPSEIPGLILTKNLYGTEIDPRAAALAGFALCMRARARQRTFFSKRLFPNVCALEAHRFTPQDLDIVATPSGDRAVEFAFWNQFEFAAVRGSLIEPNASLHSELRQYIDTRLEGDGKGDLFTAAILENAHQVLVQSEYLCRSYVVVIANPPYMGRGAMSDELAGFADIAFPASKSDLFAMFIERCRRLTAPLGITAMVTMQSWMFLPSLRALRKQVLEDGELASLAHIGAKGFDSIGGEVVQTCAFVLWNRKPSSAKCVWLRLVDGANEEAKSDILLSGEARYELSQGELLKLPNAAMSYWLSADVRAAYGSGRHVGDLVVSDGQTKTGDNDRFLRFWWEVSSVDLGWGNRWVLHPKGGGNRRWFGNVYSVIDWSDAAREHYRRDRVARILPEYLWNRPGVSWSNISTSSSLGFRILSPGEIFNLKAPTVFPHDAGRLNELLGFLNSPVASYIVSALNPTISFNVNDVTGLPWKDSTSVDAEKITAEVAELISTASADWNSFEEAIGFANDRLIASADPGSDCDLRQLAEEWRAERERERKRMHSIETGVFKHFISLFDLDDELSAEVAVERDTLVLLSDHELAKALASYAVGCMFGRFSLDQSGLILANQSATIDNYLAKVPSPRFAPDPDNAIPVVDGDWFEDDIVTRFRQFLRIAFGEKHFEENLRFVTQSLGVKDLRDYFVKSFYTDHIQRYKKRPIYWLFSSPQGSFNTLIYMHRYTPSTVSTVLNEYLREFKAKLAATLGQQERLAAGGGTPRQQAVAQKEADRIRKMLLELDEYEHDVLYPLASQQIEIDLDDGVRVSYPKLGAALKKIPGLEVGE